MDGLLMAAARLSSRIEDVPWDLIAEKIVEKHSDAQCEARFRFLNKMRGRSESDLEDSDAAGDCVSDADGPLEPESAEEADWPAVDEEDPPRPGRQPGRQAWTEEDDQRLRDAVADGLTWAGIAGRMPTRTLNGCRTRWRRIGPGA